MSEDNSNRHSRLLPYKSSKVRTRSFIKDDDLQIQVPPTKEAVRGENIEAFRNIYAHYSRLVGQTQTDRPTEKKPNVLEEVKSDMEEAKLTYDTMMDISHAIVEAYKDLKKLK